MTSDMQREAIAVLGEVWSLSPDVRLGQLLAHLGFLGETHLERGLGYIEDDELLAIIYRHKAELMARLKECLTARSADRRRHISLRKSDAVGGIPGHGVGSVDRKGSDVT